MRWVAAILDLASGRANTSDTPPAASVKSGTANVVRATSAMSVCIVVFPTLPSAPRAFASYRWGRIRQPCNQALNDTTNVVLAVGSRNGAAITSSYTLTLFNVIYSAIPPLPWPRAFKRHSRIGDDRRASNDRERIVIRSASDNGW